MAWFHQGPSCRPYKLTLKAVVKFWISKMVKAGFGLHWRVGHSKQSSGLWSLEDGLYIARASSVFFAETVMWDFLWQLKQLYTVCQCQHQLQHSAKPFSVNSVLTSLVVSTGVYSDTKLGFSSKWQSHLLNWLFKKYGFLAVHVAKQRNIG